MKTILYSIPSSFKTIKKNSSNDPHFRLDFIRIIEEVLQNDLARECNITTKKNDNIDIRLEHHVRKDTQFIIDYKQNYLAPLFYFGCGGYSGWAKHIQSDDLKRPQNPKIVEQFYEERICSLHGVSRYKQLNTVEDHIPDEFILVATQVESDTVMNLKNIETQEMINKALSVASRLNLPLVIKNHPLEKRNFSIIRYSKAIDSKYSFVHRSEGNITELIKKAKAVFVINSGVGFEALCYLKPVFIFGKSDYESGAYQEINYRKIINILQNQKTDEYLIKQFLYNYYQWIVDVRYEDEAKEKIANRIRAKL